MKALVISSFTKGDNFYEKGTVVDFDDDLVNRLVGERLVSKDLSNLDEDEPNQSVGAAGDQPTAKQSKKKK